MTLSCNNDFFKILDWILMSQEYDEKPEINELIVKTDDAIYRYICQKQFSKWYIVAE